MEALPTHTQTKSAESEYYAVEISGPGLYLSVQVADHDHLHLAEAALDIVRVRLHVDRPQPAEPTEPAPTAHES